MSLDMTSFDAALKTHYTDDRVESMVYSDNPFLALVPKMEDFGGRSLPVPILWGNPVNVSPSFATAQALTTTSKIDAFDLRRVKQYSIATIDNETLLASKKDPDAFMSAATTEIDGAINSLTNRIAQQVFGTGFGAIGNINATVSGTTLTLGDANDVVNFENGMQIVFAASDSADALRASGASLTVSNIDRDLGTMTVSANLSTITSLTSGDYIFVKGQRQDSATPSRLCIAGVEAWCPVTAPSATTFFGVDRTQDKTRLGGLRLDASGGGPLEEALYEGAAKVAREGGKIDYFFMNYSTYSSLEKSLGGKVQYIDLKVNAEIGFRGMVVNGPRGPIKVVADRSCSSKRVFGISSKTWKLYTLGKAVRVLDTDGLTMLRQSAADGVEVRYGMYGNLGCSAPGHNINIKLA